MYPLVFFSTYWQLCSVHNIGIGVANDDRRFAIVLLLRIVSSTLARSPGRLLLLGCLLIPALTRADTITCTQIGPTTIGITEPVLVLGTPEPLSEVTACVLPDGFTAPALGAFFDLMEPNPANPLLPVSDYFDITALGVVTLTSDPLEIGLVSRP